jgi:putative ABC transport system ATP-binding protein
MKAVAEVRDLHKTYVTPAGPVPVLHGVNWSVTGGDFCAITGPSGSGKTTLLNILTLLDTPSRGEVLIDGEPVGYGDEAARINVRKNKVGMIFQKFCLLPHRTALENVLFRARYLDAPRDSLIERALHLMEQLGLAALRDREARLLSGGEMQRVAIARALLVPPALLVADEPTGNLDHAAATTVMDALAGIHHRGTPVVLVTHNRAWLPYATSHYACREGRLWREA